MTDCYNCKAKSKCNAAVEPGSVMCMVNRLHYGGTHADDRPTRPPMHCQYCGQLLKVIGNKRFCNNVSCFNRYQDV